MYQSTRLETTDLNRFVTWYAESTQDWFKPRNLDRVYLARPQHGLPYSIIWIDAAENQIRVADPCSDVQQARPVWLSTTQWAALLLAAIHF